MNKYNKVTKELVEALEELLEPQYVSTGLDVLDKYKTDEETNPKNFQRIEYHLPY